ncbi:hypothetical protein EV127DRAFT_513263 [Xylaria flabelliformis]|nr:hypothetical protein EV127DRAFT_513263 [Xylaria flabelliformis]
MDEAYPPQQVSRSEMEPVTIFPGLEVADSQQQSRQFIPQLQPQSPDLVSAEVASYYILPKYGEQQLQDPGLAAIDLPIPEAEERGGRSWVFIATVAAAVTAVIVGGAVGGGLGSALSGCQSDLQSSRNAFFANTCQCTNGSTTLRAPTLTTQSPTSSTTCLAAFQTTTGGQLINYEAVPSKNVSSLGVDCDSLQKGWQVTSQGEKFSALCNVGFTAGTRRTDGNGNSVTLAEITTLIAYSFSDCLEACSGYTSTSKKPGRSISESCGSVVFKTNLAENYYANCLLLNSTVTHKTGGGACDECISATRVD